MMYVASALIAPKAAQSLGFGVTAAVMGEGGSAWAAALGLAIISLFRPAYATWAVRCVATRRVDVSYASTAPERVAMMLTTVASANRHGATNRGEIVRMVAASLRGCTGIWADSPFIAAHGATFDAFDRCGVLADIGERQGAPRRPAPVGWAALLWHPAVGRPWLDLAAFFCLGAFAAPCACDVTTFGCTHLQPLLLMGISCARGSCILWHIGRGIPIADAAFEVITEGLWLAVVALLWVWHLCGSESMAVSSAVLQYPLLLCPIVHLVRSIAYHIRALYAVRNAENASSRTRTRSLHAGTVWSTNDLLDFNSLADESKVALNNRGGALQRHGTAGPVHGCEGPSPAIANAAVSDAEHAVEMSVAIRGSSEHGRTASLLFANEVETQVNPLFARDTVGQPNAEHSAEGRAQVGNARLQEYRNGASLWSALLDPIALALQRLRRARGRLQHVHRPSIHGPLREDGDVPADARQRAESHGDGTTAQPPQTLG